MRRKIAALACAGMLGLCLVYSGCSASSAAQSYDSAYSTSNESSIAVEEPMEWGMGETAEGGMSDTAQGTTSMTAQEVESAAAGEERKLSAPLPSTSNPGNLTNPYPTWNKRWRNSGDMWSPPR